MSKITVHIDSSKPSIAIHAIGNALSDTSLLFANIASTIQTNVDLLFADSVDPYGNPWEPLRHRTGGRPLVDTARLATSIASSSGNYEAEVGTNVIYASTHQNGARRNQYGNGIPWGDIPARPFLPNENDGLPQSWENDIEQEILTYLEQAI